MNEFKTILPESLEMNPFNSIGSDWMLITATNKDGKINTMTASWGGLGVMWNKNVAFIVIRPTRYTKEFVDSTEAFSLSFLSEKFKSQLAYLGKVSGRDEDKIKKSALTVAYENATPYFAEANTVILCKTLFAQAYLEKSFLDNSIISNWYPKKDFHTLYIAEIEKVLKK